jgi:hypothetical protein
MSSEIKLHEDVAALKADMATLKDGQQLILEHLQAITVCEIDIATCKSEVKTYKRITWGLVSVFVSAIYYFIKILHGA